MVLLLVLVSFAPAFAQSTDDADATLTVGPICGVDVAGGLAYNTVIPNQASSEQQLTLEGTGNAYSVATVYGGDWISQDGNNYKVMLGTHTAFSFSSLDGGTDLDASYLDKEQISTDTQSGTSLGNIAVGDVITYWQVNVILEPDQTGFQGDVKQVLTFDVDNCSDTP
jgi:hypothetical protein